MKTLTQRLLDIGKYDSANGTFTFDGTELMSLASEFEREEWQPIETAPKDGTGVLLLHSGGIVAAWWGDLNAADSEYGTMPHKECWGWLISDGHNDPIWFRAHPYITHWMPQPERPKK